MPPRSWWYSEPTCDIWYAHEPARFASLGLQVRRGRPAAARSLFSAWNSTFV